MSRDTKQSPRKEPGPSEPNTREAILEAALRVLVEHGHHALTVRRVAAEAKVSTIGVYTWFGGKDGLVDAIWIDGFRSFAAALRRGRPTPGPLGQLEGQARAYRRWALSHKMHYRVMFLGAIPGHQPGPDATAAGSVAFELLQEAVRNAVEQKAIATTDVDAITMTLWGLVHGLVSLQLVSERPSQLARSSRLDERSFRTALDVIMRGMADDTSRAEAVREGLVAMLNSESLANVEARHRQAWLEAPLSAGAQTTMRRDARSLIEEKPC